MFAPDDIKKMMTQDFWKRFREVSPDEFNSFVDYLANGATATAEKMEEDIYQRHYQTLTKPVSPIALAKARDLANKQSRRITGHLTQAELNKIGNIIARGLELGKHPHSIASQLKAIKGLDTNRALRYEKYRALLELSDLSDEEIAKRREKFFQKELHDRRKVIATNESADATGTARYYENLERGARWKTWITTGDELVSDECAEREAQGVIPIEAEFEGGLAHEPGHPRCRCRVAYVTSDEAYKIASDEAARRAEKTERARA